MPAKKIKKAVTKKSATKVSEAVSKKKSVVKSVPQQTRKTFSRTQIIWGFIVVGLIALAGCVYAGMNSFWVFMPNSIDFQRLFVTEQNQPNGAANSPAAAVEGYIGAVNSQDGEKAKLYLSEDLIKNTSFELFKSREVHITYRKISEDVKSNKATLVYDTDQPEATMKLRFTVENMAINNYTAWVITGVDVLEIKQK